MTLQFTLGQDPWRFDALFLPAQRETGTALLLLAFARPLPQEASFALLTKPQTGAQAQCVGYQRGFGQPDRRLLAFALPSTELQPDVELVVLSLAGRPIRASLPLAFAPAAGRRRSGEWLAILAPGLPIYPAGATRAPEEWLRLRAEYALDPNDAIAAIVPAGAGAPDETARLQLDVTPPRPATVARGATDGGPAYGEPTPLRLRFTCDSSTGDAALASLRAFYVNRLSYENLRHGRRPSFVSPDAPRVYKLKLDKEPRARKAEFALTDVGPDDMFALTSDPPCWLQMRFPEGEGFEIFNLDRGPALLRLQANGAMTRDDLALTDPSRADAASAAADRLRLLLIEWSSKSRGESRASRLAQIFETKPALQEPARALLRRLADAAPESPQVFLHALRLRDLGLNAASDGAADLALKALAARSDRLEQALYSAALEAACRRGVEFPAPPNSRKAYDPYLAADALEPLWRAAAADWVRESRSANFMPAAWFAMTEGDVEARLVVVFLAEVADERGIARRLVENGLRAGLETILSFDAIERELIFAETHLVSRPGPPSTAEQDALIYAADQAIGSGIAGAGVIRDRLAPRRAAYESEGRATLLDLSELRSWRAAIRDRKIVEEVRRVQARIDEDAASLRLIPPLPPFAAVTAAAISAQLKLPNALLSDEWHELIEEAHDWEAASRVALAGAVKALAAIARWRPPDDARLPQRIRDELGRGVGGYLHPSRAPATTIVAAVEEILRLRLESRRRIANGLKNRLQATVSALTRALRDLASETGVPAESLAVIDDNAKHISGVGFKTRIDEGVKRVLRALNRRGDRLRLEGNPTSPQTAAVKRGLLARAENVCVFLQALQGTDLAYIGAHLDDLDHALQKALELGREMQLGATSRS